MSSLILPEKKFTPVEGVDFEYVPSEDIGLKIRILTGEFKNIVYQYNYVGIIEPQPTDDFFDDVDAKWNFAEDEPQEAVLKYDYIVLDNPENYATKHSPLFELLLGDVLSVILMDAATNSDSKYSMFSKNDEGKIERLLTPVKPVPVPTKTVGAWSKVKNFFFGS
jgi:hypothetical protein